MDGCEKIWDLNTNILASDVLTEFGLNMAMWYYTSSATGLMIFFDYLTLEGGAATYSFFPTTLATDQWVQGALAKAADVVPANDGFIAKALMTIMNDPSTSTYVDDINPCGVTITQAPTPSPTSAPSGAPTTPNPTPGNLKKEKEFTKQAKRVK